MRADTGAPLGKVVYICVSRRPQLGRESTSPNPAFTPGAWQAQEGWVGVGGVAVHERKGHGPELRKIQKKRLGDETVAAIWEESDIECKHFI